MKILFINNNIHHLLLDDNYPVGGATVQTRNWITGFKQLGFIVGVLGFNHSQEEVFKNHNIDYVMSYDNSKGVRIIRNIYYRVPKLFKAIKKYNPDIIYSDVPSWQTFLYSIISYLLKKTYIQRISNDYMVDERLKKESGIMKYLFLKMGLEFSNVILCQNNYQYSRIKDKYKTKKVMKAYNPFLISYFPCEKCERNYVAWIGIFHYQKNMSALLDTATKLNSINFKIAGIADDGIDLQSIAIINELKNLNNVEFLGYLKNTSIPEFLSRAYCLLNTSFYEGFSNTYLESFSVGTPVVTTKNTDPDKIIENNKLGQVADSFDELAGCILNVMNFDYSNYKKTALTYLKDNHDPSLLAEKVINEIKISS